MFLRQTRAVVLDVLSRSTRDVLTVSFAADKVPEVVVALDEAVSRGVVVRFVLETADDSAGALTHDAAQSSTGGRPRCTAICDPGH